MSAQIVLDASVAVKWFKAEADSPRAWELLERHGSGEIALHMPQQCAAETLAVVARRLSPLIALDAWSALTAARVTLHPLDDFLVQEALRQMGSLGCEFYDALAPALAVRLEAQLVSADRTTHADFARVTLLGI